MYRALTLVVAILSVVLVANGCSNVTPLAAGYFPAMLDTGEVRIIDARDMERAQLERTLNEHLVIGRFDVRIPAGEDFDRRLDEETEKGKAKSLTAGGNVLMFTDDSEIVGVIMQDARYAGAPGAITMYVMLRRTRG